MLCVNRFRVCNVIEYVLVYQHVTSVCCGCFALRNMRIQLIIGYDMVSFDCRLLLCSVIRYLALSLSHTHTYSLALSFLPLALYTWHCLYMPLESRVYLLDFISCSNWKSIRFLVGKLKRDESKLGITWKRYIHFVYVHVMQ